MPRRLEEGLLVACFYLVAAFSKLIPVSFFTLRVSCRYVPPHMRRSGFNPEEKLSAAPQERGEFWFAVLEGR